VRLSSRDRSRAALKVIVFVVGSASLGAEIAVARLLAPYTGGQPLALGALAAKVSLRLGAPLRGGSVYTDDRAPVEWLTDLSILSYAAGNR
jgi:hypothetical protein